MASFTVANPNVAHLGLDKVSSSPNISVIISGPIAKTSSKSLPNTFSVIIEVPA